MDEINKRSEDEWKDLDKTFEIVNDFDGKYIKKRSSTDINPKPIENNIKLNDEIVKDWEQLIKCIEQSFKSSNSPPNTNLNFYKFVKLIGKGAFGTVTLGIHKLTGKYVAIKTIEKSFMKDDFHWKKVF